MIRDEVDAVTLQYFSNSKFGRAIAPDKQPVANSNTERRFYKKRIIQLTKDIFKKPAPNDVIQSSFNSFVHTCIAYFKFEDASDILQEEYAATEGPVAGDAGPDVDLAALDTALFGRREAASTLDSFVTGKSTSARKAVLPESKVLNISDAKFRTKGIRKKAANGKENVKVIYDDTGTAKDGADQAVQGQADKSGQDSKEGGAS